MKKKCLRIVITAQVPSNFLQSFVQKHAKSLRLEGTAQEVAGKTKEIRINICGAGDQLDEFIDLLYTQLDPEDMVIEPFLKDKDFREVFRIIE
jgi:hypothetical protein